MGNQTSNRTKLMAAVSALSLSVGMAPAIAADQNDQGVSQQYKESHQLKLDSMQHKSSNQLKIDSMQYKESHQLKLDSMQHKNSLQLKQNSHKLNPQPLPPG